MLYLPLDNGAAANDEAQGLATIVAGIELLAAVLQRSTVVNGDLVALLGLAVAVHGVGHLHIDLVLSKDGAGDGCQDGSGDG